MPLPKISIITPSYNQAQFIRHTIDSVLSQNYPDLEYIIMDGGSTDDTVKILKSYGAKIKWQSKKDAGQSDAINQGLKIATGDILSYLNSDDILLSGALKKIGGYFSNNPNCQWLTGDCIIIDEHGNSAKSKGMIRFYKRFLLRIYSPKLLKITDNMLPQPSTFWSRKAMQKIGLFNQDLEYVMDYDYWLRMSTYFKLHILNDTLSGFRAQPNSKSETSREKMMIEGNTTLLKNGATKNDIYFHHLHNQLTRFIYSLIK